MELIEMFWIIIFFLKLFLLEISTVKKNNEVNKHVSMNYVYNFWNETNLVTTQLIKTTVYCLI